MVTKRTRFWLVCVLALVMLLSCGTFAGLTLREASAAEGEPDHKVAYYMQAYKMYSTVNGKNNQVENVGLPEDIGIKTLNGKYQYTTNNRYNNSANDSPAGGLHPESATGDYGGDGRLWGVYYDPALGLQHYDIDAVQVSEDSPLYGTPYETAIAVNKDNAPLTFKFELDDDTALYDVVIGVNAYQFGTASWGGMNNGVERTGDVYVNGEAEARASFDNMAYSTYVVLNDVHAVYEDTDGDGTEDSYILTLTVKAHDAAGTQRPAVSFISVADASSTEPAFLSADSMVINTDVDDDTLPSTIPVLTTAGELEVPVRWTDTGAFDNADNRFLLNTVEVGGVVTVSGYEYEVTVPVQFIEDNVYYYMNAAKDTAPQPMIVNKTFDAIKEGSSGTMRNDVMFQQATDGTWGGVAGTYGYIDDVNGGDYGWKYQSVYSENPYASFHRSDNYVSLEGQQVRAIEYKFTDLPVGEYTIYVGTREPDNWGGSRTMRVYANGEDLGDFTTAGYTNSISSFAFEQTEEGAPLELTVYGNVNSDGDAEDVFVGFVVITEYKEPASDVNYGDDTDQTYFLNAGDASGSRVDGIGRPYYQTTFSRAFNEPEGGAVVRDETGMAWGYYYTEDMAEGYYASAGSGDTPYSSMLYTNIDAADREMIFKFELPDAQKTYDVVIGFSNTWSTDNGNNRGANIFVNHGASPSALVTNLGYNKAVHLSGVTAEALDPDTDLENILTISLQKPNTQSGSEPTVSFISIRETGKDAVYIPGTEIACAIEIDAAALPAEAEVLTTAGMQSVPVEWTDASGFGDGTKKYFLGSFGAEGTVAFGDKTYSVHADFIYVNTEGAYYYIDTTIVDENGNTFLPPLAQAAFDAMAGNGLLLNGKADGKADDNGWGNTNVNDTTHYNGYSENPYHSVMESTEAESGLYYLMYDFTDLPAGDYLVQIGVQDPWGPRPSDVLVNGESLGTFNTVTGTDTMTSYLFTQKTDGALVSLDMTGVDGQLAGFIVIRAVDASDTAESISVSTNADNYFFTLGTDIDLTGLTILVDMGDYEYVRTVTADMISGYDANKLGMQTVTVTYAGQTASYNVTVYEAPEKEDDDKDDAAGGCSGAIAGASFAALGAALLACAAALVVRKRKKS